MRIVTTQNKDTLKNLSYAVLAAGRTSGVWAADEPMVRTGEDIPAHKWHGKRQSELSAHYS